MEIESTQLKVREPAAATHEGIINQQASSIHVDPIGMSCSDNSTNQLISSVLGFHDVGYLESHVKHCRENPYCVSYLSPAIQNELIGLLASDIQRNKYYGILLDSTPDLGHRAQLSDVY